MTDKPPCPEASRQGMVPTATQKALASPTPRRILPDGRGAKEDYGRIFDVASYDVAELEQIAGFLHFDRDFYNNEYPDVVAAGKEAITHFLGYGVNETRLPAKLDGTAPDNWMERALGFDESFYRENYPDTAESPHVHFIQHGAHERRIPFNLDENLASEKLLRDVLGSLDVDQSRALEEPVQHVADIWRAVPDVLLAHAASNGVYPKPYRNNFWLAMALGFLAQSRFGSAVCCYNFFFNYYIPMAALRNSESGMVGAGQIVATSEAMATSGAILAIPELARTVTVADPVFLNRRGRGQLPSRLELPRPVYGTLRNVEAIGGASLIVQNGHTVLYDYVEGGDRARELQSPSILHVVGGNCSYRIPTRTVELPRAFSMLHDHGNNYHHWLLEVLPRYLVARQNGLPDDIPLLVEGDIAPQMRELLGHINHGKSPLMEVVRGASVRVRELHLTTDICVNSVHTLREPRRDDILFSPSAIEMLRDVASPYFLDAPGKYENILVVRRNVSFRRLVNQPVLSERLKSLGLWTFDPGAAGWSDQVRVFSNARLIISEAGAALANLVFCRPGANIIVLVNGHPNSNFYYLAQLAQLVGARLYFFECLRLPGSHSIAVQEDMIAPVGQLTNWVMRFLADPTFEPNADMDINVRTSALPDHHDRATLGLPTKHPRNPSKHSELRSRALKRSNPAVTAVPGRTGEP